MTGDGFAARLAELWQQARPNVLARVELIERAAETPADDELREQARSAAHQLAGLLGSYELAGGSELGQAAEDLLAAEGPLDGAALAAVAADLRAFVERA